MQPGELVEVDWLDHAFHYGSYRARPMGGLVTVSSVGYLVRYDDEVLVLAQSVGPDLDFQECLHLQPGLVLRVFPLRASDDPGPVEVEKKKKRSTLGPPR